MTTALALFNFEGHDIRISDREGNLWFVAKDVCNILEIKNTPDTVAKCVDEDEKGVEIIYTKAGKREVLMISEPGFYKLVARSNKPQAKKFDRWVRHEVLPQIRKTGGYGVQPPALDLAAIRQIMQDTLAVMLPQVLSQSFPGLPREASVPKPGYMSFAAFLEEKGMNALRGAVKSNLSRRIREYCSRNCYKVEDGVGAYFRRTNFYPVHALESWWRDSGEKTTRAKLQEQQAKVLPLFDVKKKD